MEDCSNSSALAHHDNEDISVRYDFWAIVAVPISQTVVKSCLAYMKLNGIDRKKSTDCKSIFRIYLKV